MKNIISKILDIIAFCIRITTVTILTFITAIVILSCIPIFIVLLCNTKLYMFILLTFLVIWAFLRKKKDIFTCPNEKECKTICNIGYACDGCPYSNEIKKDIDDALKNIRRI